MPYYITLHTTEQTCLDIAIWLLGGECDIDREEIIGMSPDREFHRPGLVRGVDHRKPPLEYVLAAVVFVLSFAVVHDRSTNSRPENNVRAIDLIFTNHLRNATVELNPILLVAGQIFIDLI